MCINPENTIDFGNALIGPAEAATDLLLVCYSGHGLLSRSGELYLAIGPIELSKANWTAVPMQAVRETMLDSRTRNKVLILDCCFSGRAIQALADDDSTIYGQTDVTEVCMMTSSSRNSISLSVPGDRHTAFTGELLNMLHNGIPGEPEHVSLGTIRRQLVSALRGKGLPTPQTHGTDTIDLLDLVRNRAWQGC
jgi:hypothetical protein